MDRDAIDGIRDEIAALHPELDTRGLAITGRLLRLGARLQEVRNRWLAEFGLSLADFDVLATLRRRGQPGGVNPKDLQALVMITSGGMTKRLDRLEAAGLAERHPDPDDRRAVLITLTPRGTELIDDAVAALMAAEAKLVRSALRTEKDRAQLERLLRGLLLSLDPPSA